MEQGLSPLFQIKLIAMTMVRFNNRPVLDSLESIFNEVMTDFPGKWNAAFSANWKPAVNIHEAPEAYHLEMNAPGRKKEDFQVSVDNDQLTIKLETKESKAEDNYKTVLREFSFQSFERSFHIGEGIKTDAIQAKYENGILKLLLPKKAEKVPQTHSITIS